MRQGRKRDDGHTTVYEASNNFVGVPGENRLTLVTTSSTLTGPNACVISAVSSTTSPDR
jgi:hypothetical protein